MKAKSISITVFPESINDKKVVLEGQLTIRNAALIKKNLSATLNSADNIKVVLQNILKIDLTSFQLLIALQKSAAIQHKKLSYDIMLPDNLKSVFLNSGLQNMLQN